VAAGRRIPGIRPVPGAYSSSPPAAKRIAA